MIPLIPSLKPLFGDLTKEKKTLGNSTVTFLRHFRTSHLRHFKPLLSYRRSGGGGLIVPVQPSLNLETFGGVRWGHGSQDPFTDFISPALRD